MRKFLFFYFLLLCSLFRASAEVPVFNSLPGADHVIFLDFDGYTVSGTAWNSSFNSGNPIYCAASGYNNAQIETVFNMMAEDFRPFNINITTDSLVFITAPLQKRMRVLFTPSSSWYPNPAGGVAYLSTFGGIANKVCFVFVNALGNEYNAAEAGSHEAGHTLTLNHHSQYDANCTKINEYYYGLGSGEIGWAPIMGVGYNRNMTTWSNLAFNAGCNYAQSDLTQIISPSNQGVAFRTDDHGNDNLSATVLNITGNNFADSGIISTNTDVDVFKLTLSDTAYVTLNALPYSIGSNNLKANLDIALMLKNELNDTLRISNPSLFLDAPIGNFLLYPGNYYIYIDGSSNAYQSGYGSLGKYFINGTISYFIPTTLVANLISSSNNICVGNAVNFTDQSTGNITTWNWSFPGGNPASSTLQNPGLVTYNTPGNYTVSLQISDGVGSDTRNLTSYIKVNALPNISISQSAPSVCGFQSVDLKASGANFYTWSPATGLSNTVLPTTRAQINSTTTFTALGTDLNGCVNSANVTIQYFPSPVLVKNPADETLLVCRNDSTLLSVSGALTYSWTPSTGLSNTTGTSVKARVQSGTIFYTATGTDANGCSASVGFRLTARPCDSLVADVKVDQTAICAPACVNFSDFSTGNPTGWQWNFPGGNPASSTLQNPGVVCYDNPGTYAVELRVVKGTDTSNKIFNSVVVAGAYPQINITANPATICKFDSAGLKVSGAQYYSWGYQPSLYIIGYSDSVKVKPLDTTWYVVTGNINVFNYDGPGGPGGQGSFKICTKTDSIRVNVINCTTVPINLVYFNAAYKENTVQTAWQMLTQNEVLNYEVERSMDGNIFFSIADIHKNVSTAYRFTDHHLPPGVTILYYRLKYRQTNGRVFYSEVVKVTMATPINNWAGIMPNPVKDELRVQVYSTENSFGNILICNAAGQVVLQKNAIQFLPGLQNLTMRMSNLPAGLYFVKINKGPNRTVLKLLKTGF